MDNGACCFNCRFFLSFTPEETKRFRTRLAELGVERRFVGGCTVGTSTPSGVRIIRRYIFSPTRSCFFWKYGSFRDPIGSACPLCGRATMVVMRPREAGRTTTIVGCSTHPSCTFGATMVRLSTVCRFCHTQLRLVVGDQLTISCPQCRRRVLAPLTVQSWPHLFKIGNLCPHGVPWPGCPVCVRSQRYKENVVDLELPEVAPHSLWSGPLPGDPLYGDIDDHDDYFSDYNPCDEEGLLMNDELDDADDYARSHDEGWFYPE